MGSNSLTQRRKWQPTPVLLPGKSHGWRSLVGCSPWSREEWDMTEPLHFHFSLSCIGEGNGNPIQCFCLENPRDRGAWWAAIYGVTQNWTRLMRLSSSSSSLTRAWTWAPWIGSVESVAGLPRKFLSHSRHLAEHEILTLYFHVSLTSRTADQNIAAQH